MKHHRFFLLKAALIFSLSLSVACGDDRITSEEIIAVKDQGLQILLEGKKADGRWNYPPYGGPRFTALFYLLTRWLQAGDFSVLPNEIPGFDTDELRATLKSQQNIGPSLKRDGGWKLALDPKLMSSDLDTSILAYMALQAAGERPTTNRMQIIQHFVHSRGGAERAGPLVQAVLALFDQYPYQDVMTIPALLYQKSGLGLGNRIGTWNLSFLKALRFLKLNQVSRNLGPSFDVSNLFLKAPEVISISGLVGVVRGLLAEPGSNALLNEWLHPKKQPVDDLYDGQALATLLTLVGLDWFTHHDPSDERVRRARKRIRDSYEKIRSLNLDYTSSRLRGALFDGSIWDTSIALMALKANGHLVDDYSDSLSFLSGQQSRNGGFPFGPDFINLPDADDTALVLQVWALTERFKKRGTANQQIDRALDWLTSRQNEDGGFSPWSHGHRKLTLVELGADIIGQDMNRVTRLYDWSAPAVTAHVLEAFGMLGHTYGSQRTQDFGAKTLEYLQNSAVKVDLGNGIKGYRWIGLWQVNYLWGTTQVVQGLHHFGIPHHHPLIANGLNWIKSVQNTDGGWGESLNSYITEESAGVGVSTPSQTAWALIALMKVEGKITPAIERGMGYLVRSFDATRGWADPSTTGTAHERVAYLQFPIYPKAYPLIAIGDYLKLLDGANR